MKQEINIKHLVPVLFGFFIMGFIDMVGISSNYIKQDFHLNDTTTNLLLIMVFFWFAILSVPTGVIMNKVGRKNTVLVSTVITTMALLIPFVSYNILTVVIAFSLLGAGNVILQASANPLLAGIVPENRLASSLTFGQFVKAIASFLGPVIAGFMAWRFKNWKLVLPAFALISLICASWLYFVRISEKDYSVNKVSVLNCLSLLKNKSILGLFLGIILVVGIDVGLNTTVPKYLMAKTNIPLEQAGLGTSLYFVSKTIGTLLGSIILIRAPLKKFYIITTILAILALIAAAIADSSLGILIGVFITGLGLANIFSVIYSLALFEKPEQKNEISGLMMMGIAGGAIIPPLMGLISDKYGQCAALMVLLACLVYLLFNSMLCKTKTV